MPRTSPPCSRVPLHGTLLAFSPLPPAGTSQQRPLLERIIPLAHCRSPGSSQHPIKVPVPPQACASRAPLLPLAAATQARTSSELPRFTRFSGKPQPSRRPRPGLRTPYVPQGMATGRAGQSSPRQPHPRPQAAQSPLARPRRPMALPVAVRARASSTQLLLHPAATPSPASSPLLLRWIPA